MVVLLVASAHVLAQVIIGSNVDAAAAAGTSGRQTTEDWSTVLGSMFGEHPRAQSCCSST
jgi:hypothetical protein